MTKARTLVQETWSEYAYVDDLVAIQTTVQDIDNAERTLRQQVDAARAQNISWSAIGDALGVTRSAAQQRFG